jgi:hypothetical protein
VGKRSEQNFYKRFEDRIEVIYADKPLEGEERRLNHKSLVNAVKVVMTAALKREPTREELLGIVPVVVRRKNGGS